MTVEMMFEVLREFHPVTNITMPNNGRDGDCEKN